VREVISTVVLEDDVYVFMSDGCVYRMILNYDEDFTLKVHFTLVGNIPDADQTNN
jgi:hypothetical protein